MHPFESKYLSEDDMRYGNEGSEASSTPRASREEACGKSTYRSESTLSLRGADCGTQVTNAQADSQLSSATFASMILS